MSKETIDYLELGLLIYIAIFVTGIGFRQITHMNQNKEDDE